MNTAPSTRRRAATPDGYPAEGQGDKLEDLARRHTQAFDDAAKDPAFAAPISVPDSSTRARAKLVYRDLPIVTIQNTWTVEQARGALYAHMSGRFDASGQLLDAVLGDDRVTATLNSRATALFGREVRFKAANDSAAAKECLVAWIDAWERLSCDSAFREMQDIATMMGDSPAQLLWDTSKPVWQPYLRPWHNRFTYWDWDLRRFIALTNGPSIPIEPGNGKWVLHSPFGSYRGWVRGALRAVTEPWMLRHFGFRDMARFGEVHGLPTRVGKVPAVHTPEERAAFETALAGLGSDAAMVLPQGVDTMDGGGYEYDLVEATSTAWQVHPGQIDRCDMAIVLAILMVNLTTEVQGGAFAASKSHMDVRQGGTEFDNRAWRSTIYHQVARVFAYLNFGDADLAPWTCWDVTAREDYDAKGKLFSTFGAAVDTLRRGGIEFTDAEGLRKFAVEKLGLEGLPEFKITEPVSSGLGGESKSKLPFTDVDPAAVVTVNEARELNGLGTMPGGDVTIAEFHADKQAKRDQETEQSKPAATAPAASPAPEQDAA